MKNTVIEENSAFLQGAEPKRPSVRKRKRKALLIVCNFLAAIYFGSFIFALLNGVHKFYSAAQATLVILGNLLGLFSLAAPFVLNRLFGVSISDALIYLWWAFAFCHCALGETCMFYYYLNGWDKALHCLAGTLFFFTFFGMARSYLEEKHVEKSYLVSVIFAFAVSMALACVWEIGEFAVDSIFGTNMQKLVPKFNDMFNGGDTFAELNGTAEEIAAFYRTPDGYRFAIKDTMYDCIVLLAGVGAGLLVSVPVCHKKENFMKGVFAVAPRKSRKNLAPCPEDEPAENYQN